MLIACPNKRPHGEVEVAPGERASCPKCGKRSDLYAFNPVAKAAVERATIALPQDARCFYHPNKKATEICAGSGNYICSLCAVKLHDQVYSAQYLEAGGKEKAAQTFERYLARPDRSLSTSAMVFFLPFLAPLGCVALMRAFRLRRNVPLYRLLVPRTRLILIGCWLLVVGGFWALAVAGMIMNAVKSG